MFCLNRRQIVTINKRTVEKHGGNFVPPENILHNDPLEYLAETVQAEMFGQPLYPTVADKAALYMFSIISNHFFQDGNKRTGLASALIFIDLNGYLLKERLSPISFNVDVINTGNSHKDELYRFTVAVASGLMDLSACQTWFAANIRLKIDPSGTPSYAMAA
ncbi:MAG: death-on-curing protein [Neolewinella sp.]|jgi:death-on-curing protein